MTRILLSLSDSFHTTHTDSRHHKGYEFAVRATNEQRSKSMILESIDFSESLFSNLFYFRHWIITMDWPRPRKEKGGKGVHSFIVMKISYLLCSYSGTKYDDKQRCDVQKVDDDNDLSHTFYWFRMRPNGETKTNKVKAFGMTSTRPNGVLLRISPQSWIIIVILLSASSTKPTRSYIRAPFICNGAIDCVYLLMLEHSRRWELVLPCITAEL